MVELNPLKFTQKAKQRFESAVYKVMTKYGYGPFGRHHGRRGQGEQEPPYHRQISPEWIKSIAEQSSLVNNSIEEKVNQSFRRGFTEWTKLWEARCPECHEEFETLDPFVEQMDGEIEPKDIDFDSPRLCPECEEIVEMDTPDPDDRHRGEEMMDRVNFKDRAEELMAERHNSISQTFLELCKEVAFDIQTFDDGWMIFQRRYHLDENGNVEDWELDQVIRAPPYLMRYSLDDDGKVGGEYWVCIKCRAQNPDDYQPEQEPGACDKCGNRTYECYAYALGSQAGKPEEFYVRGEFAHGSEYRPSFLYGLSPVISLFDEARTLQQMDRWYREAYEKRRAPRGAIVVSSSNAESVRSWNTEQMTKMSQDSQHIPTFINDTEDGGDPLKWVPLLEDPAQMQHMQMREWFLDRISAKYGVTAVFQTGGASSSGMSQSLEIVVSNRSAQRLQQVFNDIFIPAFIGQLKAPGWTFDIEAVEEEDEQAEAQRIGRHLQNAQLALGLNADVEWTRDDEANIKPGELEQEEEGGGLGGLLGGGDGGGGLGGGGGEGLGGPEPGGEDGAAGETTPGGGRPNEPDQMGGAPDQPDDPTSDEPYRRSNNSVTTNSGGYSNPRYGANEEEEELIDYLSHVREEIEEDDKGAEKRREIVEKAVEEYKSKDIGPGIDTLKDAAQRPDKRFQYVRRMSEGDWTEKHGQNRAAQLMYEVLVNG